MYPTVTGTYDFAATASSGLTVTYSITSGNNTICKFDTVVPTKLQFLATGDCVIRATQAGDNTYNADFAVQTITVGALNQWITFPAIADRACLCAVALGVAGRRPACGGTGPAARPARHRFSPRTQCATCTCRTNELYFERKVESSAHRVYLFAT